MVILRKTEAEAGAGAEAAAEEEEGKEERLRRSLSRTTGDLLAASAATVAATQSITHAALLTVALFFAPLPTWARPSVSSSGGGGESERPSLSTTRTTARGGIELFLVFFALLLLFPLAQANGMLLSQGQRTDLLLALWRVSRGEMQRWGNEKRHSNAMGGIS
jgi:hypothetical protein